MDTFTRGAGGEATEVEDLVAGGLRSFLWGAGEADFPVSTLDEGGIEQMYVAAEGMVLGRLDGGTFVPMAQDGQGSMLLDGADFLDVGAAFGEDATHVSGSPERRVYALLEDLPGTPYKLPRRRLYDEETGRFASQDPIGLMGGDHRFAYVGGDPMGAVDPSGMIAMMPTWRKLEKIGERQAPDVLRKSCWRARCSYEGVSAAEGTASPVGGTYGMVAKAENDALRGVTRDVGGVHRLPGEPTEPMGPEKDDAGDFWDWLGDFFGGGSGTPKERRKWSDASGRSVDVFGDDLTNPASNARGGGARDRGYRPAPSPRGADGPREGGVSVDRSHP